MITTQTAVAELTKRFGDSLRAVYRVGLADASPLCDLDLVLVFKDRVPSMARFSLPEADIRGAFTEKNFVSEQQYLPYKESVCIYGEPIPTTPAPTEANLVKLGFMFFYAFARNLYRARGVIDEQRHILTNLNDFEYALQWLPNSQWLLPFVEKVRAARVQFPGVSDEASQALLGEGIDASWKVIEQLNAALSVLPEAGMTLKGWSIREKTIFLDASAQECRSRSEANEYRAARAKVLFLPQNFARIIAAKPGSFAAEYVRRNLNRPMFGTYAWLKQFVKSLS